MLTPAVEGRPPAPSESPEPVPVPSIEMLETNHPACSTTPPLQHPTPHPRPLTLPHGDSVSVVIHAPTASPTNVNLTERANRLRQEHNLKRAGGSTATTGGLAPAASFSMVGGSEAGGVTAHKPGKSVPVTAFNSPKDTLLGVIKAGLAKSILPWWRIALLGFNAGLFLSFGSIAALVISSQIAAPTAVHDASGALLHMVAGAAGWGKFVYGVIFPIGLVLIVLAGSELFTGNVMYLTAAVVADKAHVRDALKNLSIVWLSNLAGSAFAAYFLTYLPELLHTDPMRGYLVSMAAKKMSMGWGIVFLRGVGCNMLVCLAMWCNLTAQDVISKLVAIWMPIATFVWIGWEHSVANMYVIPMALMEGVPGKDFGDALAWNLIPVTLGNIVGGGLFALGQVANYAEFAKPKIQVLSIKHLGARTQSNSRAGPAAVAGAAPNVAATPRV